MQPLKIDKPIRLIELFAGIGSQAKALKLLNANFEHYRICEFDKYAIKSYNAIHGTNFETSDITKITADDLGIVDTDKYCYIMTYSFPCQDLSLAGKQKGMAKGENTRSGLLWEVERLLNECTELPQILLMENVTQVHGKKNIEHFNEWIEFLESKGYSNYWKDLNSKNFGIPQNRNRTFMVSVLGNYTYEFPQEFPLELRLKDMLEKEVDEKYYLSDKGINSVINGDISKTVRAGGRGSVDRHSWDLVAEPKVIGGIGEKKSNGGRQWYLQDRIYDNEIATSVTTAFNPYYKADLRIRKLTPKECWRLMGFTDEDFHKAEAVNSNTQLYKQAGNSIVKNCLVAIFGQMIPGKENIYREVKKWD
jgi:DNA (cytosine-5)-methyltransferase 1